MGKIAVVADHGAFADRFRTAADLVEIEVLDTREVVVVGLLARDDEQLVPSCGDARRYSWSVWSMSQIRNASVAGLSCGLAVVAVIGVSSANSASAPVDSPAPAASVAEVSSAFPAVAAARAGTPAVGKANAVAATRIGSISAELADTGRDRVALRQVATSADGAPILVSGGSRAVCLTVAGSETQPGAASCFPATGGTGVNAVTTYLGNGSVRVDALTQVAGAPVAIKRPDGVARSVAPTNGVVSVIVPTGSKVTVPQTDGSAAEVDTVVR